MKPSTGPVPTAPRATAGSQLATPRWTWRFGLLLTVVLLVVYGPALRGGFIWDDDLHVSQNPTLRDWAGLKAIWFEVGKTHQYYPLVHSSFWLEYRVWGLNPVGYHVVNVLLHALAAFLLFRVLARLGLPGAWFGAALFALHPVCVESVAWISERKNVLSTVFYLSAALAYLRYLARSHAGLFEQPLTRQNAALSMNLPSDRGGRRSRRVPISLTSGCYWVALLGFVCALLSKTVTCSLPAALLLVIWWKRGRITWRDAGPLLPFWVAGVVLGLNTVWLEKHQVGAQGAEWALSFGERGLIAGRALWFYAGKLVWPANLTFIYPRWEISTAFWWQWSFPVAAVGVVIGLWLLRRRIGRGPLVAVLFFAGTLFPALGFFDVYPFRYSFVADHFQYLASVGLIALAAAGIHWASGRRGCHPRLPGLIVQGSLLLVLGILTWRQCRMYADLKTLWETTIQRNPGCSMAHNNLGEVLFQEGRVDEAMAYFQKAVELQPHNAEALNNLGNLLLRQKQVEEAIQHFRLALKFQPNVELYHSNLGTALSQQGRLVEAIWHFERAIALAPGNPAMYNNLAWVLATSEDAEVRNGTRAVELAERAVRLSGGTEARFLGTLAAAYAEAGRFEEAVATAEKARALAQAAGNNELAVRNEALLKEYRARRPYREGNDSIR